jgi:hypothetical protein
VWSGLDGPRGAAHGRGDSLTHVVLRAGDYVRHVDERFADDYALAAETSTGAG